MFDTRLPHRALRGARSLGEHLLDRQDILDCLIRFSRGMDRFDRKIFLSAFHPDATIAAGAAENSHDNLRLWIKDPSAIKPGSLMPAMKLSDADLDAVVSYMETLH